MITELIEEGIVQPYNDGGFQVWIPARDRRSLRSDAEIFEQMVFRVGKSTMGQELASALQKTLTMSYGRAFCFS